MVGKVLCQITFPELRLLVLVTEQDAVLPPLANSVAEIRSQQVRTFGITKTKITVCQPG